MPLGILDPSSLGKGFQMGERGKIAEELANIMGYPSEAQGMGDAAFYGADPYKMAAALGQRRRMDLEEATTPLNLNIKAIAARAPYYSADQTLAGQKYGYAAKAQESAQNRQNLMDMLGIKLQGQRDQTAAQSQSSLLKALLGMQGQLGAAKIRAGSQQAQMFKTIPDLDRSALFNDIVKRFGEDPEARTKASAVWMHLMPNEPIPDQMGGLMQMLMGR